MYENFLAATRRAISIWNARTVESKLLPEYNSFKSNLQKDIPTTNELDYDGKRNH